MPKGIKAGVKKTKQNLSIIERHTDALNKHSKALNAHAKAMRSAASAQKNTDALLCLSQWLIAAKHLSQADSTDPSKSMATDFRIAGAPEISLCLNSVSNCLLGKGHTYKPGPADAATLATKTLGEVVYSIASKMT